MNWYKAGAMKWIEGGYRCNVGPDQGNGDGVVWKWMSSRAVKELKGKICLDQRSAVKDDGLIVVDF